MRLYRCNAGKTKGELSFYKGRIRHGKFPLFRKPPGDDPGETYDIREYRSGDSIRQIHWKLSGKLDDIMIREKASRWMIRY